MDDKLSMDEKLALRISSHIDKEEKGELTKMLDALDHSERMRAYQQMIADDSEP